MKYLDEFFMIVILLIFLICASVADAGDAPYSLAPSVHISMNIFSYADVDVDLTDFKTFNVIPSGAANPLLEKELLYFVRDSLISRGLIYDKANPDLLISIIYYIGSYQEYVPRRTISLPIYKAGSTTNYSGRIGSDYFSGSSTSSGSFETKKFTVSPGHTKTNYYRKFQLLFFNAHEIVENDTLIMIWKGEAESSGSSPEIRKIAPPLISELLDEFPVRSGKPIFRRYPSGTRIDYEDEFFAASFGCIVVMFLIIGIIAIMTYPG